VFAVLSNGFTIGVGDLRARPDCEHVALERHTQAASFQVPQQLKSAKRGNDSLPEHNQRIARSAHSSDPLAVLLLVNLESI
jgi:hypothetical protein